VLVCGIGSQMPVGTSSCLTRAMLVPNKVCGRHCVSLLLSGPRLLGHIGIRPSFITHPPPTTAPGQQLVECYIRDDGPRDLSYSDFRPSSTGGIVMEACIGAWSLPLLRVYNQIRQSLWKCYSPLLLQDYVGPYSCLARRSHVALKRRGILGPASPL
jgi:hypothetical protein